MLNYKPIRDYLSFEDLIKKSNYRTGRPFASELNIELNKLRNEIRKECKW